MRLTLRFVTFCAVLCPAFADAPPRFASERLRGKTDLLPNTPSDYESIGAKHLKDEQGAALTADFQRALERKGDGAWKTFEDDLVSFEYPDEPLLRVTPIEPGEGFGIVGGAIGNADRSFKRAYRIVVGPKVPYLTIFVQETDRFDDGICLCGPIVHDQLLVADGTLLRFSYLPSGAVKKVQALGAKHRAIALEWTHTAITQEAFARIGKSLRLRQTSEMTREQWMAKLDADIPAVSDWPAAQSKLRRKLPWIEPQMSPEAVRALLGAPAKSTPEWDFFEEHVRTPDGQRWRFTSRVPYRDGQFARFDSERSNGEELEPEPESVRWAEKLFRLDERAPIPGLPGLEEESPKPKPTREAAKTLADAFLKRADEQNGEHWRRWCAAMAAAFKGELGDPRVLTRVEDSFLDLKRDQMGAIEVLRAAASPRLVKLFLARSELIAGNAQTPATDRADELAYLVSAIDEKDSKGAQKFVRTALTNPTPAIRRSAVDLLSFVMRPEARLKHHASMLDDPDATVRQAATGISGWDAATRSDIPTIEARLAKETNSEVAESLRDLADWIRKNAEK